MKSACKVLVIGLLALSMFACAKTPPPPAPDTTTPLTWQSSELKTTVATVTAVNLKTRKVTLRSPEGRAFTIHVGKDVVNLRQVKKGDVITVTFSRELEVFLAEPGEQINEQTVVVATAKPGSKPRGVGVTQTIVTAKIYAVDKANQLVKMEFIDGTDVVVKAQNPANLDKVKAGDTIAISYIEAVDIAVNKKVKR
ncbi:MAG: hypothetical protein F8N36_11860 [Desulfovibrio sp.]|uniref:hypothetical protein n=1 Tax=Desulfovibrio sp. TaxID=885 RepID=UPI00135DE06B|nr:hypothetical protein [Desulfovibrio sp.]MTJ93543.1 hypothetical protein [Desulfovibrio sp.]